MPSYRFARDARLCCAKDYQQVFNSTLFRVHQPSFLVLAGLNSQAIESSRLGLVVAKKKIKKAHERNRIKRLTRDSFRHARQHLDLQALDIVVMPKIGAEQISNTDLAQQLQQIWKKLHKLLKHHHASSMVENTPDVIN